MIWTQSVGFERTVKQLKRWFTAKPVLRLSKGRKAGLFINRRGAEKKTTNVDLYETPDLA
jgi:hypothetical protein